MIARRLVAWFMGSAFLLFSSLCLAAPVERPQQILETRIQFPTAGLFVANADGSGERPLLAADGVDYNPSWSPDGRWIVFTSERNGLAELYRVKPDGTGLQRLTDNAAYDDQASFSPTSNQLVYVSTLAAGFANLWTLDLRTHKARAVTTGVGGDFRPAWSPDGRWIAFASDRGSPLPAASGRWEHLQIADVYVVHPDGSGLKRLTEPGNFCGSPKWTPDGRHVVAYCMTAQETLNARTMGPGESRLVLIEVATGVATPVTADPGQKFAPSPLPSGGIGYIRKDGPAMGIYYDQAKPGPKGPIRSASWSPDGRRVVFHRVQPGVPPPGTPLPGRDGRYQLASAWGMMSYDGSGSRFVGSAAANGSFAGGLVVGDSATSQVKPLFTREGIAALTPQWSPATDSVVFGLGQFRLFLATFDATVHSAADRIDGGAHIATIKPDGSGLQELTTGAGNDGNPSPSPDGKRLVYRTFGPAGNGLRLLDLETKAVTTLTTDYDNFPFWSPRGDLIMFCRAAQGDYEIYTIRPDGTGLKRLTYSRGNDAHMGWSPDGEWIAFASTRMGFKDEAIYTDAPQPYGELFVMRYDGTGLSQLTDNQWEDGAPTWRPQPR